jgi:hypothetical protein
MVIHILLNKMDPDTKIITLEMPGASPMAAGLAEDLNMVTLSYHPSRWPFVLTFTDEVICFSNDLKRDTFLTSLCKAAAKKGAQVKVYQQQQ